MEVPPPGRYENFKNASKLCLHMSLDVVDSSQYTRAKQKDNVQLVVIQLIWWHKIIQRCRPRLDCYNHVFTLHWSTAKIDLRR